MPLGLTGDWVAQTVELGLLESTDSSNRRSLSSVERTQPIFQLSDYMVWNADTVLKQLMTPRIMVAWSLEDHLSLHNISNPGIVDHVDQTGFLLGCQVNSIYASLSDVTDESIIFSFDIFHAISRPIGPSLLTHFHKKDVVNSMKTKFSNINIVQRLAKKGKFKELDPYGLFKDSNDMFLYWLEIAVGVQVEIFVSAGGDIDNSIRFPLKQQYNYET